MDRKTLTVTEVAEMIGVSPDSICTMVREKQIPHMRVRARILFRMETIYQWKQQLEAQNLVSMSVVDTQPVTSFVATHQRGGVRGSFVKAN